MLGLQKLCVEQNVQWYNDGFLTMLDGVYVGDLDDFSMDGTILSTIPTRHFQAVYLIADRMLSAAIQLMADGDEVVA